MLPRAVESFDRSHTQEHREGRQFRKTRDRRAVEAMTTYGRKLLQDRWLGHEHDVLAQLHDVFIDLPQAVDIAANPGGLDFLHRDVCNVTAWFRRHGIDEDPEEVFADLLSVAFG